MRPRYILAISACIIIGFAASSSAEFYRYRDANGVLRFTDNPAEIPENQLPENLQTYKRIEDFRPPEEDIAPQQKTASPGAGENAGTEDMMPSDALIEQRRGLSSEHAEITKLTQKINSEKALAKTPDQRNEYNEKVRLLNERISAYEQKRKSFDDNLKTFNEELNKKSASPDTANDEAGNAAEEESAAPDENKEAAPDDKTTAAPAAKEEDAPAPEKAAPPADEENDTESPAAKSKSSVTKDTEGFPSDITDEEKESLLPDEMTDEEKEEFLPEKTEENTEEE